MSKQLTPTELRKAKMTLVNVLDKWLEDNSDYFNLPWIGNYMTEFMADAALAVLRGTDDAQAYLIKERLLKD